MKEHIFKQYPYRIELHAHTTPASSCSNLKPEELVQLYHEKGYGYPDVYVQSLTSALVSIFVSFAPFSIVPPPTIF